MRYSRDYVRTELLAMLQSHAQGGATVTLSSHLVADLGIDSLGVMELLADIEDKFKIHVPDDALRDVDTAESVVRAITKRLEKDGRLDG